MGHLGTSLQVGVEERYYSETWIPPVKRLAVILSMLIQIANLKTLLQVNATGKRETKSSKLMLKLTSVSKLTCQY